ncbi:hypothetical protein VII00023_03883 [Vibrio ichthyoenteri ATCC 700023]|uniref:Lipoprotein n=1 Tax=Vibrio ichthyoenteri ATCC 700023 TaxID=870968 RepID=F9S057_9VIBR|nr:DUF2799 domain-containing protein [Vibrio ichthyoenteri]EGU43547.1 hypothetical protein VII00023_03883 [Vibrio ichthyoenteri ATCC 700023]
MRKLVVVAMLTLLAGCASSVEQLVQSGDWYQVGYQDGVSGNTQRSYSDLAKLGQANQADYDQGYLSGVEEYCNPDFAYQIGLSGQYYEGVCEGSEDAQQFRMEWQRGWSEHQNSY